MHVSVNNERRQLPLPCTVADLLQQLGYTAGKVAVAVNSEFVPRSQYAGRQLADGDCVDVLAAVQGG